VADPSNKRTTGPKRSAAAEMERLAVEKEAADDRVFALTHRVATLETRERDLNELIVGHRERVATLEAERGAFGRELEGAKQELDAIRERTMILHEQVARLEAEEEMLNRTLAEERSARSALEQEEARLRPQLERIRERVRALQAERSEAQRGAERRARELQAKFDESLREREAELGQARELAAAFESTRDELAAELESEQRALVELRDREGELRDRERELEATLEGVRDQVSGLEAQLTSLAGERDRLAAERDRLRSRLEQLESSRTYRVMRITWRMRARIRHPFRRATPRPALSRGRKAPARTERPATETPAIAAPAPRPATEPHKLKPIPTPAMRRPSKPGTAPKAEPKPAEAEKPKQQKAPDPPAEPEKSPEPVPEQEKTPERLVTVTEEDLERERWLAKPVAPPADVSKLRVAGVLDEMSAACFEPDCDLLRIDSQDWAEALETHEPHLLLVESTWQGNNGSWQYMVASYTHPDYIGLPNLKALIAACRERDIPTVFWNKEDPVHFERFKEAAALFDYVFTSDSNCIDRYAALEREGTGPISALQFAAQPLIHNPIGAPAERNPSPVFAGAYYRDRHIDRQTSLQMLLDAAMPFGLQIYDRRFGSEDKAFGFPERFTERVQGALAYDEMIDAYKDHRVFLNVNSVTDSPTMFSRRVFELLACGTAVVSTESVGVQRTLGDVVSMIKTPKEATDSLTKLQDDDYWRELTQRGRRRVMGEHTYRHRLAELAGALGFNVTAYPGEEVAALALVDDVEQARRFRAVAASISAQETRPAELLIGSHTSVVGDLQELQSDGSEIRVRVVQQVPEASRSQRYRELAALAASPWLAILHPAHTYGEHHLADLVLTTRFADADVIGNASFETTEGTDAIDRSLEHRFVDSVHPHSVLVKRELVARRGWPDDVGGAGGTLSDWFRHGVRIYSGDAGNFLADAALGHPGRAAATGSDRAPDR
jgi:regulator of replication initiation timing